MVNTIFICEKLADEINQQLLNTPLNDYYILPALEVATEETTHAIYRDSPILYPSGGYEEVLPGNATYRQEFAIMYKDTANNKNTKIHEWADTIVDILGTMAKTLKYKELSEQEKAVTIISLSPPYTDLSTDGNCYVVNINFQAVLQL